MKISFYNVPISFKNYLIMSFIALLVYLSILIVRVSSPISDYLIIIIYLMVTSSVFISLFYAVKNSKKYGKHTQKAWKTLAIGFLFFAISDSLWYLLGIKSEYAYLISFTYLIAYILLTAGVFLFPGFPFTKEKRFKTFLDMGTVILSAGLTFLVFLFIPAIENNHLSIQLSLLYMGTLILDFALFFALVKLLFSHHNPKTIEPIMILTIGLIVLIITDSLYISNDLKGIYTKNGLLSIGWTISYVLIGLAAFSQATNHQTKFKLFSKSKLISWRLSWIRYPQFLWVIFAYTLLIWSYNFPSNPYTLIISIGVGITIALIFIRQLFVLNENEKLYESAKKEIIRRKKAEKEIKMSLEEKEVLLKEVHHRVKNNLQIILSLLSLQSLHNKDVEYDELLKDSQSRIKSMALIHEKLYHSKNMAMINFADYIPEIVNELLKSYNLNPQVKTNFNIEDIYLDIDTAVPCGLIINELTSNSLKHAFEEGMHGKIMITLHKKENKYELTIKDDGKGIPDDIDPDSSDTLGLKVVNALIHQIDGDIKLNRNNGTEFVIKFKIHDSIHKNY